MSISTKELIDEIEAYWTREKLSAKHPDRFAKRKPTQVEAGALTICRLLLLERNAVKAELLDRCEQTDPAVASDKMWDLIVGELVFRDLSLQSDLDDVKAELLDRCEQTDHPMRFYLVWDSMLKDLALRGVAYLRACKRMHRAWRKERAKAALANEWAERHQRPNCEATAAPEVIGDPE